MPFGRTEPFAIRVFRFAEARPKGVTGRVIAGQVARSASGVAANCRAAQRAPTRAEFAAKLIDAREEADKTIFGLELAVESGAVPAPRVADLLREADGLTAILTAAIKTTRRA